MRAPHELRVPPLSVANATQAGICSTSCCQFHRSLGHPDDVLHHVIILIAPTDTGIEQANHRGPPREGWPGRGSRWWRRPWRSPVQTRRPRWRAGHQVGGDGHCAPARRRMSGSAQTWRSSACSASSGLQQSDWLLRSLDLKEAMWLVFAVARLKLSNLVHLLLTEMI